MTSLLKNLSSGYNARSARDGMSINTSQPPGYLTSCPHLIRSERSTSFKLTYYIWPIYQTLLWEIFSQVLHKKSVLHFFLENDPPREFCFAIIHSKYQKINKILHDQGLGLHPKFSSALHLLLFSQNLINSPGQLYCILDMLLPLKE